MNILIVFATNSGTTQVVQELITGVLTRAGHTVTVKEARDAKPEDINASQVVLLGSPSWDFGGSEGMTHEDFVPLMEKLRTMKFDGKPFAIFGLGDSSYKHFCGAVDHLEKLVADIGGKLATPSLHIDNYYTDVTGFDGNIAAWTEKLMKTFTI